MSLDDRLLSFDKELKKPKTFSRPNHVGSNWAKMTESTRPRPSSPIVRGKAVEVEMSRWFFKSCSFDDRAQRSWQGDPNIPAKDRRRQGLALNYMALSPGWSWSAQGKWSISSQQASTHGKRASSPSARGSREPWKCSGEEVEEDSAFLQEPSPLSSQVVLDDFRSMIYVWKLKPSTSLFRFKPFLSTSTPRARGRSAKALVAGYKGGIQCF